MSEYLDFDCKNCGRHRVESNGICEKCNFDNILNEFAQPVLECLEHGAGTCRNADLIDTLRAEIARRDEELALTEKKLCNIDRSARAEIARRDEKLKITDGLLKEATETIGAVVACCTYNSNDDAKIGIYGIDQKAFTRIDQFITHYNDAVSAGKVSVDVKTSPDNNKCMWVMVEDPDIDLWCTSCGEEFHLEADTPSDNHMKYCCYCGKEISEG